MIFKDPINGGVASVADPRECSMKLVFDVSKGNIVIYDEGKESMRYKVYETISKFQTKGDISFILKCYLSSAGMEKAEQVTVKLHVCDTDPEYDVFISDGQFSIFTFRGRAAMVKMN